ncbi:hypothetical protein [Natronoglycomyces albus]|uniref:Uncharacterized protein n=1 Tax=Natronoglycomyces albus TaxID=2811108 RepID=A0A895XPS0_9ACTN|nr:hypothetical protein [Natronoglycomyces albus]QSB07167.1 hypothetical protein JQS30_17140 [Natronoglycomyces albus]
MNHPQDPIEVAAKAVKNHVDHCLRCQSDRPAQWCKWGTKLKESHLKAVRN